MPEKHFSLEEANRALAEVRPLLEQLRAQHGAMRAAAAEVAALVKAHGEEKLDTLENPDRAKYWGFVRQAREAEERVQALIDDLRWLGAEPKDPEQGLVDFRTRRGGETVYLCWKLGEPMRIAFWHDMASGFAGRRPIAELEPQQ